MRDKLPDGAMRTALVLLFLALATGPVVHVLHLMPDMAMASEELASEETDATGETATGNETTGEPLAKRKARREEELSALTRDLSLSSDRQAAIDRTSRVENPVAMRSRIRPARRRSASA